MSGHSLVNKVDSSHLQFFSFCLGNGSGPGVEVRDMLGGADPSHLVPATMIKDPASVCSVYVSLQLKFHLMARK